MMDRRYWCVCLPATRMMFVYGRARALGSKKCWRKTKIFSIDSAISA